jgi:hypothetical protein
MGAEERIVGYARVSTAEQGANGAGLAAQRAAIEAECGPQGWQLVATEEDLQDAGPSMLWATAQVPKRAKESEPEPEPTAAS